MKSWEVLRDAADRIGVKKLAAELSLSTALVYKWCQESTSSETGGSGARNPLDRILAIYAATGDERIINWLCIHAAGSFVKNPEADLDNLEGGLLTSTQRFVEEFGGMLQAVSRSIEDDGQISLEEASHIRQTWESLKMKAESFVVACERGMYMRKADDGT